MDLAGLIMDHWVELIKFHLNIFNFPFKFSLPYLTVTFLSYLLIFLGSNFKTMLIMMTTIGTICPLVVTFIVLFLRRDEHHDSHGIFLEELNSSSNQLMMAQRSIPISQRHNTAPSQLNMQAPVVNKTKYSYIINNALQSVFQLIELVKIYPTSPDYKVLLATLRLAQREAMQQDYISCRGTLQKLLANSAALLNYDSGDALSRGYLGSARAILRTTAQNAIDNAIKAKDLADPNTCPKAQSSQRENRSRGAYRLPEKHLDTPVRHSLSRRLEAAIAPSTTSRDRDNTISRLRKQIRDLKARPASASLSHSKANSADIEAIQHRLSLLENERFLDEVDLARGAQDEQPDSGTEDWTEQDARDFDCATYYGSETWFLD